MGGNGQCDAAGTAGGTVGGTVGGTAGGTDGAAGSGTRCSSEGRGTSVLWRATAMPTGMEPPPEGEGEKVLDDIPEHPDVDIIFDNIFN